LFETKSQPADVSLLGFKRRGKEIIVFDDVTKEIGYPGSDYTATGC